ncbi:MAG: hypothetical protein WCP46_05385, partial [Alphaproteobacteria bacterium]
IRVSIQKLALQPGIQIGISYAANAIAEGPKKKLLKEMYDIEERWFIENQLEKESQGKVLLSPENRQKYFDRLEELSGEKVLTSDEVQKIKGEVLINGRKMTLDQAASMYYHAHFIRQDGQFHILRPDFSQMLEDVRYVMQDTGGFGLRVLATGAEMTIIVHDANTMQIHSGAPKGFVPFDGHSKGELHIALTKDGHYVPCIQNESGNWKIADANNLDPINDHSCADQAILYALNKNQNDRLTLSDFLEKAKLSSENSKEAKEYYYAGMQEQTPEILGGGSKARPDFSKAHWISGLNSDTLVMPSGNTITVPHAPNRIEDLLVRFPEGSDGSVIRSDYGISIPYRPLTARDELDAYFAVGAVIGSAFVTLPGVAATATGTMILPEALVSGAKLFGYMKGLQLADSYLSNREEYIVKGSKTPDLDATVKLVTVEACKKAVDKLELNYFYGKFGEIVCDYIYKPIEAEYDINSRHLPRHMYLHAPGYNQIDEIRNSMLPVYNPRNTFLNSILPSSDDQQNYGSIRDFNKKYGGQYTNYNYPFKRQFYGAISKSNQRKTNFDSWYSYNPLALEKLLKLRLENAEINSNVKVYNTLFISHLNNIKTQEALLKVLLTSIIRNAVKIYNLETQPSLLFIPLLIPETVDFYHWVGIIASKKDNIIHLSILDSDENYLINKILIDTLQNNKFNLIKCSIAEQQRYNNCGPELIENFVYYLTGSRASQEAAVYVHSLLMENALLDQIEYALKISENSKLIGFLSNQTPLMVDRPITDTNSFLAMSMQKAAVRFEMSMFSAESYLSELLLPRTQYLYLETFDHVKQVSVKQTNIMSRDPVLVVDNEVSSDQEPATLLAQNIVLAILPIESSDFSVVSSTALVAIASGTYDSFGQPYQDQGSDLFTFIHILTDKITSTLSNALMNAGGVLIDVIMKNDYIKHQLINYVYHEELSAINTVINKLYIQSSTNPAVQLLLQKHPLQWSKKDFKNIKLVVHPDKGGEAEDFRTVNAFEEQVGNKDQMCQNLLSKVLPDIQALIYKSNIGFKVLDMVVDSSRLIYEPTLTNAKKVALDSTYLYSMYYGINSYSSIISAVDVLQLAYQEEYIQALKQVATTIGYMALPSLLAYTAIPHLGLAYGIGMAGYTGYSAITNAYSFYLERTSDVESILRSIIAYRDLAKTFSESPLQQLYDFTKITKGYEVELNNITLAAEKKALKSKLVEEKGEFGQKLYDHIYESLLEEKYNLLNQVLQGIITEEEKETLKAKHVTISSGEQNYEHCMEIKDAVNNNENDSASSSSKSRSNKNSKASTGDENNNADIKHYYCYNDEKKLLDYVLIGDNHFEVVESF